MDFELVYPIVTCSKLNIVFKTCYTGYKRIVERQTQTPNSSNVRRPLNVL